MGDSRNRSWLYPQVVRRSRRKTAILIKLFSWFGKILLAILDQGIVVTGSIFLINIFLIRCLSPSEYGFFSLSYSFFIFLQIFHSSLILEPMNVIGLRDFKERIGTYICSTIWIHFVLCFGLSILFGIVTIVIAIMGSRIASPFLAITISLSFILLVGVTRRASYLKDKIQITIFGSILNLIITILSLIVILKLGYLSTASAFFAMAFASIINGLFTIKFLDLKAKEFLHWHEFIDRNIVLKEHWNYGKWVLASGIVSWIANSLYIPLLSAFEGVEPVGAFRAMQNLMRPIELILIALGLLFVPKVSEKVVIYGYSYLRSMALKISLLVTGLSVLYTVLVTLTGDQIVFHLYKNDYYLNNLWLLPFLGGVCIIKSLAMGIIVSLKAAKLPNTFFWAALASAFMTLTLGLFLVWRWGIYGMAIGYFSNSVIFLTALILFFDKHIIKQIKRI